MLRVPKMYIKRERYLRVASLNGNFIAASVTLFLYGLKEV